MSAGIYCIKNEVNERVYVGRAVNFSDRWKQHIKALEENKHSCKPLQHDFNLYGFENFTFKVLEVIKEEDNSKLSKLLDEKESKWGHKLGADKYLTGYNFISKFVDCIDKDGEVSILNTARLFVCKNATPAGLAVYLCILAHYDEAAKRSSVSMSQISKETGIDQENVKLAIQILETLNVIKQVYNPEFSTSYCYRLNKKEANHLSKEINQKLKEKNIIDFDENKEQFSFVSYDELDLIKEMSQKEDATNAKL